MIGYKKLTKKVEMKEKGNYKRNSRIRVYGFHSWLKLQPYFLIGGDLELEKWGNYLTAKKGRVTQKTCTVIL